MIIPPSHSQALTLTLSRPPHQLLLTLTPTLTERDRTLGVRPQEPVCDNLPRFLPTLTLPTLTQEVK